MVLKRAPRETERDHHYLESVPTVSALTEQISDTLTQRFDNVVVQGEVSQWTRASSGHTYFTLKDEKACLSCVLWRGRPLRFTPSVGMRVIASGRITLYPPRGAYQLDCAGLSPLGQGELQIAFERLKGKLLAEGLFELERKRPLPRFPRRIGVITSRDGAALRDIITTLQRRMPSVELVVRPALVQGATAAEEIALGIRQFNTYGGIDLLIVGRGGGSIEDLWAFNEEVVARALADSAIPTISAVGHEIDFTIADFVADARAATPTAAAELAVRDCEEMKSVLEEIRQRLGLDLARVLTSRRHRLDSLVRSRGSRVPSI